MGFAVGITLLYNVYQSRIWPIKSTREKKNGAAKCFYRIRHLREQEIAQPGGAQPPILGAVVARYMQPMKVENGGALFPIMPYYDEEAEQPFDSAPQWLNQS